MAAASDDDGVHVEVAQEYVSQFLGFTPLSFVDELYNAVSDLLDEVIDGFSSDVQQEFGERVSKRTLDKIKESLKYKVSVQQDNVFDTLEADLVGNVFNVLPDAILPEDECQAKYPAEKCDALDAAIASCEGELAAQIRFLEEMEKEKAEAAECLAQLKEQQQCMEEQLRRQFKVSEVMQLRNRVMELDSSTALLKAEWWNYKCTAPQKP